jgi:hypothetical protein
MARIRTIKPSFFRHRELYLLEQSSGLPVRLGFAGLWTVADREGRFRWQPEELKLDCLPYDDVRFSDVLDALDRGGFVRRYVVAGKAYGFIPSWAEHQVIGNREAQSTLPATRSAVGTVITEHAQGEEEKEGKGKGKGTEGSSEALTRSEPTDSPVLLTFPTIGTEGDSWRLRRVQVDEWRAAFPGIDVLAECQKALGWVKTNPGRRKTPRGMPKFLYGWIARSVNSGTAVPDLGEPQDAAPKVDWYDECREIHGGACGLDRLQHHNRKVEDQIRARERAAS